jgi:hypothetical protein
MNCFELIHNKELVSSILESNAPLCLYLKNALMVPECTVSRVDLHDFARSLNPDHIVNKVPLVLDHGNVLKYRNIVVSAVVVKELGCIIIITIIFVIILAHNELGLLDQMLMLDY